MLTFVQSCKTSDLSVVFCFASLCKKDQQSVLFCKVSIEKATYFQLLTSFRRSNEMFVDAFIECDAWSCWWTWCVLQIICNSKHFSFFVFHFNLSNKISSTQTLAIKFSIFQILKNTFLHRTPPVHASGICTNQDFLF